MIRADPPFAADLREHITGRREDPAEQAWSAGPWPKWMSSKEAENFLRNIPWAIEIVLGTYRASQDGVDIRMLKVTSKDPPPAQLPIIGEKWFLVMDNVTVYIYIYIYITKCESRWPMPVEAVQETQIYSGSNTRKWAVNQEKGKLPFFKLRTGEEEEEASMQVDGAQEEEKKTGRKYKHHFRID